MLSLADAEAGKPGGITLGSVNNEPVAWAIKSDGDFTEIGWDDEVLYEVEEWYIAQGWQYEYIPLYTHPVNPKYDPETGEPLIDGYPLFSGLPHTVKDKPHPKCDEACMYLCQMRELTDEEIIEELKSLPQLISMEDKDFIEFARAILRKAQEQ
jgi:hypothetical protein